MEFRSAKLCGVRVAEQAHVDGRRAGHERASNACGFDENTTRSMVPKRLRNPFSQREHVPPPVPTVVTVPIGMRENIRNPCRFATSQLAWKSARTCVVTERQRHQAFFSVLPSFDAIRKRCLWILYQRTRGRNRSLHGRFPPGLFEARATFVWFAAGLVNIMCEAISCSLGAWRH